MSSRLEEPSLHAIPLEQPSGSAPEDPAAGPDVPAGEMPAAPDTRLTRWTADHLARGRAFRSSPAALYIGTLSTGKSRRGARESLRRVSYCLGYKTADAWIHLPWEKLTSIETTAVRALLLGRTAPATASMTLSVLKGVLTEAFRAGYMKHDEYVRAVSWPKIRAHKLPKGRALTAGELTKLHEYLCELPGRYSDMMLAIFAAAVGGGLRREELANLRADALSKDGRTLFVLGKGRRERLVPLMTGADRDIGRWVAARRGLDLQAPTMFIDLTADGRCMDRPLSPEAIWRRVRTIFTAIGVTGVSTHDLRRTYASRMLERADLPTVARLMGHANTNTTAIYDRRDLTAAEAAARSVNVWGK